VISCASRQVYKFVQWIMQQPFYENTTIVITGDHCSMDRGYFSRNVEEGYERHVYNCFINAVPTPAGDTTERVMTSFDLFPTTLAAIGFTVEGDRLGLGVDLFSTTPTLAEQLGYHTLETEINKFSDYYIREFS
jgi:phosphoglycerol transferase